MKTNWAWFFSREWQEKRLSYGGDPRALRACACVRACVRPRRAPLLLRDPLLWCPLAQCPLFSLSDVIQ